MIHGIPTKPIEHFRSLSSIKRRLGPKILHDIFLYDSETTKMNGFWTFTNRKWQYQALDDRF